MEERRRTLARLAAGLALACAAAACASLPAEEGRPDGRAVYFSRCAMCHPAWDPRDHTPEEWPAYVRKYGVRAGLTRAERDAVLAFLVREAATR